MTDFATARRMMVDNQIRPADVTDLRLLAALETVPREEFLPPALRALAYLDFDLAPLPGCDRRMLKPMLLARLVQAVELGPQDRVLDLGCLTGYSAAVLARLAGQVTALDEDHAMTAEATRRLAGLSHVTVVTGPLPAGWPPQAPYDVIVINGACEAEPDNLLGQLADGGRLVCILREGPVARAVLYLRSGGTVGRRILFDAAAATLPGFARETGFVF